jgi:hypothetical protein
VIGVLAVAKLPGLADSALSGSSVDAVVAAVVGAR